MTILHQIAIGSVVICLSIVVEGIFIMIATNTLQHLNKWLEKGRRAPKMALAIISITLWLLAAHSIAVWMWAFTYYWLGTFATLEPALYFSIVSFTTLGFGDIILPVETRLLSGLSAANGMIAFGLSTAFLVEVLIRIRKAHLAGGPL